ncbi:thioredoxin [Nesterenkonia sp. AN1]|uniref:Putative thioredoxin n=1 Tax=Nesterenkonia aurantiaca TaxID=1436010 RepID=A0A4R7G4A1_9MICC|nr:MULTISPECIES: tetratricopeptide repeat protein [Nesterenkonia]EXF24497.1 thioredoxin [Nesterenkonia sp. AN1]TDS86139.1 putative thioredoxin [Nesterenkonia aurantiaca]
MTDSAQEPQSRRVDARGAVDLSGLASQGAPAAPTPAGPAGQSPTAQAQATAGPSAAPNSWAIQVQPQQLQQVVELSGQAPVIVLIHGADAASATMKTTLEDLVDAQQGRLLLAEIDSAAHPELAQSADQVPVATAFIGGRPVGEFDASVPADQLAQLVTQMVQMATQNGMTQKLPAQSTRVVEGQEPPAEPELPPLHQAALDALENSDYAAAATAYQQAIKEKPDDEDAKIGLAQVKLLQRTTGADLAAARQAAAENPDDIDAQIAVADLDVLGGHVEDGFSRLVRFIQTHFGDDRETARAHLVELYSITGDTDPRVSASRKQLARALF